MLNYKKTTLQAMIIGVLVVVLAGIALGADAVSGTAESDRTKEAEVSQGQSEITGEYFK